jgi:hypothetical protein
MLELVRRYATLLRHQIGNERENVNNNRKTADGENVTVVQTTPRRNIQRKRMNSTFIMDITKYVFRKRKLPED